MSSLSKMGWSNACHAYMIHANCLIRSKTTRMHGELASMCSGLGFLTTILGNGQPFIVYSDSLSLVYLVKRRFTAASAINSAMVKRLLLVLSNFHFILRYLPDPYLRSSADFLTRIEMERECSVPELLDRTTSMNDFVFVDENLRKLENEDLDAYNKRSELNEATMRSIEEAKTAEMSREEIITLFASSHLFSENAVQAKDAVTNAVNALQEEEPDEAFKHPFNPPTAVAADFEALQPRNDVEEPERVGADEFIEPQVEDETADLLSELVPSNNISAFTTQGIKRENQDIAFIGARKYLADTLLDPNDGYHGSSLDTNGPEYVEKTHSLNLLRLYCEDNDIKITDEILYTDVEQIKQNLNYAFPSESVRAQKKYFLAMQKREQNLRLIYEIVSGKRSIDHEECNYLRRIDPWFKSLTDNINLIIIHEGLLWYLRIPFKYSAMRCCLICPRFDALRLCKKQHNLLHRGSTFDFSMLSLRIYTQDLLGLCREVQRSCVHCSIYFLHRRTLKTRFSSLNLEPGAFFVDLAGPIARGKDQKPGEKSVAYVMVILAPLTWSIVLVFLQSKDSEHVWDRFLHEFLRYYPGCSKVTLDNGSEFSVLRQQCALLQIAVHSTAAHHAQSNRAEMAVRRFSKAFKLFLTGNAASWRKSLSYLQILLNTSYSSPHTGLPPYYAQGMGEASAFYSPYITFRDGSGGPQAPGKTCEAYEMMR